MMHLKIFGSNRYQQIEEEFNTWSKALNPYVVKTVMDAVVIPRSDIGHSLFFTLLIFYTEFNDPPEVIRRGVQRNIGGA